MLLTSSPRLGPITREPAALTFQAAAAAVHLRHTVLSRLGMVLDLLYSGAAHLLAKAGAHGLVACGRCPANTGALAALAPGAATDAAQICRLCFRPVLSSELSSSAFLGSHNLMLTSSPRLGPMGW